MLPSSAPPIPAGAYPALWSGDLREDVERCVARASALGLETLVLERIRAQARGGNMRITT